MAIKIENAVCAAIASVAVLILSSNCIAQVQEKELRIGLIATTTGGGAQNGKDMIDGFNMYLEETGGEFAGAKVRLIIEDDLAKPDLAVAKAKKLILEDHIQILVGGVIAPVGYALAPVSTVEKIVYLPSVPAADDLTQRHLAEFPYLVRTGWTSSQPNHALGQWACDQGYRKIATVAVDNAFGYGTVGGFQKVFEDCGGKIVQKLWPPFNSKDFGPYITSIRGNSDTLFSVVVGPMELQFPKQLRQVGYMKPLLGAGTSYDENALPFMGDGVIGHVSALQYSAALETPDNEKFVKKYRTKFGKVPSYYSESNYTTALLIDEVMKQTNGRFISPDDFVRRMTSLKVDAPRGPISFDDMRNPIQNIYIRKVEKKKMFGYPTDELWNAVIKTYPAVSQFWTYGKNAFLKQPVYSREFPPCNYCE
jgi:branched-chain amino acid transport system substrate-binding protein